MTDLMLVHVSDLVAFSGVPSSQALVDSVSSRIRRTCGWHIAPQVKETLVLDSIGAPVIVLPTLRLVDVSAVRYWSGSQMVPLTSWNARTGWSAQSCSINCPGGFPAGDRVLEVDITHGYKTCPEDLLQAIVALSKPRIVQEALSGHSLTLADGGDAWGTAGILARYTLGPRP